jgi:hypothetical protein
MTRSTPFLAACAAAVLLGLSACAGESRDPLSPSLAAGSTCSYQITYENPKFLTVPHNSSSWAGWFIKNTGTNGITFTGETRTRSGSVTGTGATNWVPYPYTLAAGSQIDADLTFTTGAPGSGTVGMTVASSCGSIVLPNHFVTVN